MWQGRYCQIPTDCAGNMDASGKCCTAELSADGMCCAAVDADMACCVSGELDASGACLGAATSIDLQGAPCQVRACAVHTSYLHASSFSLGHAVSMLHRIFFPSCLCIVHSLQSTVKVPFFFLRTTDFFIAAAHIMMLHLYFGPSPPLNPCQELPVCATNLGEVPDARRMFGRA